MLTYHKWWGYNSLCALENGFGRWGPNLLALCMGSKVYYTLMFELQLYFFLRCIDFVEFSGILIATILVKLGSLLLNLGKLWKKPKIRKFGNCSIC